MTTESMLEIRRGRGLVFKLLKPRIKKVIALRISLHSKSVKYELGRMAKEYGAVVNIKAIKDREFEDFTSDIMSLVDIYDNFSRNKRKELLRFYLRMMEEESII